jgi:phage recombination protein Bet
MNALIKADNRIVPHFSADQVALIKSTICKGATDDELKLFMYQCERTGLDPLARQIYSIQRREMRDGNWVNVRSIQTSIDGFRLVAERSGKYAGQVGPYWCGEDGQWQDVWLKSGSPIAARVGVLRSDFKEPCWGVARFDAYAQKGRDGIPTRMWKTMGDVMIAKCAEALALRKAFPQELSGLYTSDEMEQAQQEPKVVEQPKATTPHDQQTGEILSPTRGDAAMDWIKFGQDMIAAAKSAPNGPEQVTKNHAEEFARMEKEAPKVYKRMTAAIGKLKQPQPSPNDDPEAWLKWIKTQCDGMNTVAELQSFQLSQADAFAQAFPPDVAEAQHIIKQRVEALGA